MLPWEMDPSYHIQTSVSVQRGIIWGISVHIIHKGGGFVVLFVVCTCKHAIKF